MPGVVAKLIPFLLLGALVVLLFWRGPEAVTASRSRTRLLFIVIVLAALAIVAASLLSGQP